MNLARILPAVACVLAAHATAWAEPAAGYRAERGSRLASQQVPLPAAGANARVPVGELVGAAVENRHGDRIGQIDDVVVDLASQRLDYAVVRLDAEWLGTSKHVVVPPPALVARSASGSWVLDADPARAMALPEFSRDKLARVNDARVVQEVHRSLENSPWMRPAQPAAEPARR